jgi:hypothetical protein
MRRLVEDEDREDLVVDTATAAQTIAQHKTEILQLKHLEQLAQTILRSGHDRKWDEVSKLIQKKRSKFDTDDNPGSSSSTPSTGTHSSTSSAQFRCSPENAISSR